jgi:putative restriction endonuclease
MSSFAGHDAERYLIATFSRAIAEEAKREWPSAPVPPGAAAAFAADSSSKLRGLVQRLFQLARSLPPEPLAEFETQTRDLPHTTEAERLVIMRVGQDTRRDSVSE